MLVMPLLEPEEFCTLVCSAADALLRRSNILRVFCAIPRAIRRQRGW